MTHKNMSVQSKLVEDINELLDDPASSLTSTVRRAARLAFIRADKEYTALFDLHLNGLHPKDFEKAKEGKTSEPSKSSDDQFKWDVVSCFTRDRMLANGNILEVPLEEFESRYRVIREMAQKAHAEGRFDIVNKISGLDREWTPIYARIRNRVGSFARLVEQSLSSADQSVPSKQTVQGPVSVFIGHGGASAWKDLRDFLTGRLNINYEEFNREPTAGKSTKERLEEMLNRASFAFLVMTAEDQYSDSTLHARENVIHEVGLFQGRLGFTKAIVLLEEGCEEFSNIRGLTQIRFPRGNVIAADEEIRRVLEREGVIREH